MAKAVLTTKPSPAYDDLPEQRYHFPSMYLNQVQHAAGDFIVYYEPRRSEANLSSRGGRQAYWAAARISEIVRDSRQADHYYAVIADFVPFDSPVPFRRGAVYFESALRKPDGSTNKGAFGRAVRDLPDGEFEAILRAGFAETLAPAEDSRMPGLAEEPAIFERPIVEQVLLRPMRDRAFALAVRGAYNSTCAVTGLRLINGGGRPEIDAAHIRPVAESGPDSVRNGIALCKTVHWMFDRGMLSFSDDLQVLCANREVESSLARLMPPHRRLHVPGEAALRPHPQFLHYHRTTVFKG